MLRKNFGEWCLYWIVNCGYSGLVTSVGREGRMRPDQNSMRSVKRQNSHQHIHIFNRI